MAVLWIAVLLFVGRALAAGSSFSVLTVSEALMKPGWEDPVCPYRRSQNCLPQSHLFRYRQYEPRTFSLDSTTSSLNFALFDRHDPNYVHAIVRMTNLEGVRKVHFRTGPHSLSINHGQNKQHALWGYGVVPELEIELYPRSGNDNLLETVRTDIIFFIHRCALDTTSDCENFATDLLMGIENKYTTQMVMHPMSAINHQVHKSLEGETSLHLHIEQLTPGKNRYYLTRSGNAVVAVFNNAQGDPADATYTINAWMFMMLVILIIVLGAVLVYLVLLQASISQMKKETKQNDARMIALQQSQADKMTALEAVILNGNNSPLDMDTDSSQFRKSAAAKTGPTTVYTKESALPTDRAASVVNRNKRA